MGRIFRRFGLGLKLRRFRRFIEAVQEQGNATYKEKVQRMSEISGFDNPDLLEDGDYAYFVSEDNTYAITALYKGTSTVVIVPFTLCVLPVRVI